MEYSEKLREQATHCIRLSHGLGNPADVAQFEAYAAELDQAAEAIEAEALAVRVRQGIDLKKGGTW